MPISSRLASVVRNLFRRKGVEQELDDELRAYLDHLTDEKRRAGMDAADARRAARIELGGIEQVKEEVRQVRGSRMFEQLLQDLRYGIRTLSRDSAFTIVAILALAVGIGANTAMFSVAYGILVRPLPFPEADRLAVVYMSYFPRDFKFGTMSLRDYLMWKEDNHAFEDPSIFSTRRMDIAGQEGVPEQVQGASVTAGFFSTLGVPALLGRSFAPGEDKPGASSLTVLSEAIWRRRFAANPNVLGETIVVNGAAATVIGVMPDAVRFPGRATEVWTNLPLNPPTRFGPWFYRGVARLKPGMSLERAQIEVNNIGLRMMQQNTYYKRLTMPVLGMREALLGVSLRPAILVLVGAVGLVLLIAVVNVANLMLARATVREREMALRLSLGAGRGRLIRQLLTESTLLAIAGGTAGLALAWGAIEALRVWNPGDLPLIDSVHLDSSALLFMLVVSLLTGIVFGLAPAFAGARADLNSTIKETGRGGGSSQARGRARATLVVSEIALSLMLLVGAGLLLRSFVNLQNVSGGFSVPPRQILTVLISPGNRKYSEPAAAHAFYDEVIRRARNVPGVEMAGISDSLPPDRQGDADSFEIEGQTLATGEMNPVVSAVTAGAGFFETLRIPLMKGRYPTIHDTAESTPVTIVSEGFAQRFFPAQDAIGKRIRQSGSPWMQIVGVVGNVKYLGLTVDTDPAYYIPFSQSNGSRMFLSVRSSGDAAPIAAALRREIQSIDAGITLAQIGTMEQALEMSVSQPRFNTALLVLFAAIALLLAAVGIYGLIAYSVAQRTHEIGVRMALGAAHSDVLRMVVGQGATLAGIGILIGLGGAFGLTRLLSTMMFGIGVTDALTFAIAPVAILLVVLAATFFPAVRATRVSPVTALRYD